VTGGGEPRWRLVRAGTDAVPASVRRFFQTPRRRTRNRPGRLWVFAGTVVVLVVLAGWVAWGTSLLGVRQVRVTGIDILSAAQVREAAAVTESTPLLQVRTGEVADRVGGLPAVAEVRVSRDWPGTLVIRVVERTAVAAVPTAGASQQPGEAEGADAEGADAEGADAAFELLDAEGVVFHTVPEAPLDLPVVVLAEPGPADPATRAALTVLAALTPPLRAELKTLTVAGPASIELSLFSGLTVLWGDESASEDKAQVATALLDHEGLPDHDEVVIDVSAPEVVSVR
jgi:cell division protein FtsQ